MTQTVEAIYEGCTLKPLSRLELAERAHVRVTVQLLPECRQDEVAMDDPLSGLRVDTGTNDLAANFDSYRFGDKKT